MSLAKALHTYGELKATKIPIAEGADCTTADMEKIQDLMDRGYRYISTKPAEFGADEIQGHRASQPLLLRLEEASWEKSKGNVPFQSHPDDACTDPTPTTDHPYPWHFKNTYFYAEKFNWYNESFGRNVYFEGMKINERNATHGEIEVYLDSSLTEYNLGNGGLVIVGENDEPIVEFDGTNITAYVDVEVNGSADTANIYGKGSAGRSIDINATYDNNFEGTNCG